jgi:hypothetical protein
MITLLQRKLIYQESRSRFSSGGCQRLKIPNATVLTFTESSDQAAALLATAKRAPDYREGVLSFIERRPPEFAGLGEATSTLEEVTS